jgi:hypothetical protein
MKLSQIRAAKAAIETGARVKSPTFPGVWHRVRGLSCLAARKLREKLVAEIPRAQRLNGLTPDDGDRIEAQILAEVVWLGVEGLTDDAGSAIVVTPEKARELFADPDCELLRADVRAAAMVVGEEQLADIEADAKN